MKISLDTTVKNFDGKPFVNSDEKKSETTLRDMMIMAAVTPLEEDRQMPAKKKFELGALANRVHSAGSEIDLSVDDVTTLKNRIGSLYHTAAVFAAWTLIENGGEDIAGGAAKLR